MKPRIHNRKLLLYDEEPHGTLSSPAFSDNNPPVPFSDTPAPAAVNATSAATSSSALSFTKPYKPLDSSLTLTLTILLAALFFMGFFSIYVRRFSDDDDESTVGNTLPRRRGSESPSWPSDRPGLDLTTVRSLPVVPYCGDAKHRIDCTICLAEFEEGEAVKLVPHCKHVFHPECIDRWLNSHVTCPLCRGTMSFGAKGTSGGGGGESVGHVASSVPGADTCIDVGSVGLRRTRSYFGQGEDRVYIERALSF